MSADPIGFALDPCATERVLLPDVPAEQVTEMILQAVGNDRVTGDDTTHDPTRHTTE